MNQRINMDLLSRCEPLDDDTVDIFLRTYCGLEQHETIAYINSIQMECALHAHRNARNDAVKKLGPLFRNKAAAMEGMVVLVHGPKAGNPIVNDVNQNNHWSILYYSRLKNIFYHYDSHDNFNYPKVWEIISFFLHYEIVRKEGIRCFVPDFIPQQPGNWECSYFCIAFAYILGIKRISYPIGSQDIVTWSSNELFDMRLGSIFRNHLFSYATEYEHAFGR